MDTSGNPPNQECGLCSNGPHKVYHYGAPCPYQFPRATARLNESPTPPPAGDEVERLVESITDQIGYIDEVGQLAALARNRPQREESSGLLKESSGLLADLSRAASAMYRALEEIGDLHREQHPEGDESCGICASLNHGLHGAPCDGWEWPEVTPTPEEVVPSAEAALSGVDHRPQREERLPEDVEDLRQRCMECCINLARVARTQPFDRRLQGGWQITHEIAVTELARRCAEAEARMAAIKDGLKDGRWSVTYSEHAQLSFRWTVFTPESMFGDTTLEGALDAARKADRDG